MRSAVWGASLAGSAVVWLAASVTAHETSVSPAQPWNPTGVARGVVFHDVNENRVRDPGEPGVEKVRVSNGRQIALTDPQGRYELPVDDDTIVFLIKPRNWMTPINEQRLPQFYYIHKPKGSPPQKFAGVKPTGPLPASIDFALMPSQEPDKFCALFFGDTQPRNVKEVEYMAHDVIEPLIEAKVHGASLGVTLGDIVFDDLSVMGPHNQAVALLGIPWYNVIGNHDMNYDAVDDKTSDETFESVYGPNYYSFDHGPVHFLALDDVSWIGANEQEEGHYHAGLGPAQMEFIRNDLAAIPKDQLVVLMMHIPLLQVEDRHELYRLIEERPFALSVAAHTHHQEHYFIGAEDGWRGPQKHHHVVNVTVCGSWWKGLPDVRGIPHATMSDGAPNGYSIFTFDGRNYDIEYRAASLPADAQMKIHAPNVVAASQAAATVVLVNVFAGSEKSVCRMRIDDQAEWTVMEGVRTTDPDFVATRAREIRLTGEDHPLKLPTPHASGHMWRCMLPVGLEAGTHVIEIESTDMFGRKSVGHRVIRVDENG